MVFCKNCGREILGYTGICSFCGTINSNANQFGYSVTKNSGATASFVLGIIGIVFWLVPIFAYPLNIVGLVLGVRAKKISITNKGTAGFVLSLVGLILTSIRSIIYIIN